MVMVFVLLSVVGFALLVVSWTVHAERRHRRIVHALDEFQEEELQGIDSSLSGCALELARREANARAFLRWIEADL